MSGRTLREGTVKVRRHFATLSRPRHMLSVGEDTSSKSGTIVAAKTDEHDAEFGDSRVSSDKLLLNDRSRGIGRLIEERKTNLVVNLDVVFVHLFRNAGKVGAFLDGSQGELALRSCLNNWCLFHL